MRALAILALAVPLFGQSMPDKIRAEFLHSWRAYERHAWGHDELRPMTRTPRDWYGQSLMITPVDSLDALLLMGFKDEAAKARKLIVEELSFDKDIEVKNFEITIRVLGGLLSAYEITGDPELLRLADDLGTRLLPAFSSPTGMPYMFVNLRTGQTCGARTNPAEIGTLILEFGILSRHTSKPVYFEKAKKALVELFNRRSEIGLVGEEIDVETGEWITPTSHVGGAIDSYYEYLLKCALLFNDGDCCRMWDSSVQSMNRYLEDGAWYGEADMNTGARTGTYYGALHAFLPGVLAVGGDLPRARRLEESSYRMWKLHGIEPEVLDYKTMKVAYPGYPLRPEIIESAYVLHRYTHDPRYLEMGKTFFDSLVKYCRVEDGYTNLRSVVTKEKGNLMPSYFLAETLKYLYLLYAPEALDFDTVVFNTEAHPFSRLREKVPEGRMRVKE